MSALLRMLGRRTWFVEDEICGLEAVVSRGATCLDVGAEYGLYTHALAVLAGSTGQVHSIEPLPGAYRMLAAGVALAGRRNVRCHRLALGEQAERGTLSLPRRRWLSVHGRAFLTSGARGQGPNSEFASSRPVPVEVLTLDQLCARERIERLDFVKVDVEGHELAVLRGGEATLAAHGPALLLEIEDRHLGKYGIDAQRVVTWLAERGYAMYWWADRAWRRADCVASAHRNYLFLR